jgi:fructose-bisphosphate aldolase, class II
MPLVDMKDMLDHAYRNRYAVGAFDLVSLDFLEEIIYTSLDEARTYVERTGVDCLAVSIGTVHGRLRGRAELDFARLAEINESLHIPLVIHGGTGLSAEQRL